MSNNIPFFFFEFTIIYASGYLKANDFLRIGWKMMLLSFILLLMLATFYWPLIAR